MNRLAGVLAGVAVLAAGAVEARPLRVMALDQCADQYVMALVPPDQIVGVTPRADDADARERAKAWRAQTQPDPTTRQLT